MNEADPPHSSYIVNCVFNGLSAYTAITSNVLTIHAIRKTSSLPTPLKTLLLSLAVSDLGIGLLVQPLQIAWLVSVLSPSYIIPLKVLNSITFVFIYTSVFTVVAISVDRFLAIHLHLRYQELVTPERVVAVVISIWVLSPFLSSMWLWVLFDTTKRVYIIIYGLCFICGAIAYCRIYLSVRRHTNQIQVLQVQQEPQYGEMINDARRRKSAVSTFYVYFVFLVCYLPIYCLAIVHIFSASSSRFIRGSYLYLQTLMLLNSSLNPVIYCWKMRHIRHTILETLRNLFPSQT